MGRKLLRIILIVIALLAIRPAAHATHQRAGEISYVYISGLTYEFTIVTYTYTPSPADRPEIEVYWGDGTSTVIPRHSKTNLDNNISRNVYIAQHTFSAAGTFHVTFEDPNRNAGIVNIPSSVEIPFFIETNPSADFPVERKHGIVYFLEGGPQSLFPLMFLRTSLTIESVTSGVFSSVESHPVTSMSMSSSSTFE